MNSTKDTVLEEQTDGKLRGTEGGASASGSAMGTVISIPTCSRDDEFLTSNGTHLLCRRIPPCTCFVNGAVPEPDSPTFLQPPTGCPVYEPPLRGATACYLNSSVTLMYCHVYCDHNFEFLSTPTNPYSCGPSTNFNWLDVTGKLGTFPECTAHRLTIGTIHSIRNYLPSPCYGLTDHTILAILNEFKETLRWIGVTAKVENIFMQCPSFNGTFYFYDDVKARSTH